MPCFKRTLSANPDNPEDRKKTANTKRKVRPGAKAPRNMAEA